MRNKKLNSEIKKFIIACKRDNNPHYLNTDDIITHLKKNFPECNKFNITHLREKINMALQNFIKLSNRNKKKNNVNMNNNSLNDSLSNLYSKKIKTNKIQKINYNNNSFSEFLVTPKVKISDIGGYKDILTELKEFIIFPFKYPEVYSKLGVNPPKGILLSGPSGVGKTYIAMAVAKESGANFLKISGPEFVTGISGESEGKIRQIFDEAKKNSPCILLIDEIDSICSKANNSQKMMEKRITAQLLSCLDNVNQNNEPIIIIATTNKPDCVDSVLRRGGRFDKEIKLKIPEKKCREDILRKLTINLNLEKNFDIKSISLKTSGFVAADLVFLTKEAVRIACKRIFNQFECNDLIVKKGDKIKEDIIIIDLDNEDMDKNEKIDNIKISTLDFILALKNVIPCFKREGFTTIPSTTWNDIGGLDSLREEMRLEIVLPILNPEIFKKQGLETPTGVLFFGPPGCGKTLLAKAIANEAQASFISVKGPELLNSYVGETEKSIRELFLRASTCSPCIIFFDEIESLIPIRGTGSNSNQVSLRIVTQMLTELDGLEDRKGVFVIGATNRPDVIDSAFLRPGRFGRIIYVPIPSKKSRLEIFNKYLKKVPHKKLDGIKQIFENCEGFSGADCRNLVQKASQIALGEYISVHKELKTNYETFEGTEVKIEHFEKALKVIKRSVDAHKSEYYKSISKKFCVIKNKLN